MKKLRLVLLLSGIGIITYAHAGLPILGIPNNSRPVTFLGPSLVASFAAPASDNMVYAVLGELGIRNMRADATLGWQMMPSQRFKVTGEWLRQELTFPFFDGNENVWLYQFAGGADYQILVGDWGTFDLSGYYAYSPSKTLGTDTFTQFITPKLAHEFVIYKRVAGANAAGGAATANMNVWCGGVAGLSLNYDDVRYNRTNSTGENTTGFGGGAYFQQTIFNNLNINLAAEIRQPFDYYEAGIGWNNIYYKGRWGVTAFGSFVSGKVSDIWNAGIAINYADIWPPVVTDYKMDYKHEVVKPAGNPGLLNWASNPAVYLPQVFSVTDQKFSVRDLTCKGLAPTVTGTIPDVSFVGPRDVSIPVDASSVFSGEDLFFSLTYINTPGNALFVPPNSITINAKTGLVTINLEVGTYGEYLVTVTTANRCGSASTSFLVAYDND